MRPIVMWKEKVHIYNTLGVLNNYSSYHDNVWILLLLFSLTIKSVSKKKLWSLKYWLYDWNALQKTRLTYHPHFFPNGFES